jgi:hypothetical protein
MEMQQLTRNLSKEANTIQHRTFLLPTKKRQLRLMTEAVTATLVMTFNVLCVMDIL